jgi:tRNA-Thr(GGU) m(6)t(6)A37 methyltransferase TsaA
MFVPEDTVEYEPIGTISTPFDSPEGMPIQPAGATATEGIIEFHEPYAAGLQDLKGFTHCIVLYHFHAVREGVELTVEPFLDEDQRGLFATRAPRRPNPIGLSVVTIEAVDPPEVLVSGIDVVDGTPLLDLKPFVPEFDAPSNVATGWLEASESTIRSARADDRFR